MKFRRSSPSDEKRLEAGCAAGRPFNSVKLDAVDGEASGSPGGGTGVAARIRMAPPSAEDFEEIELVSFLSRDRHWLRGALILPPHANSLILFGHSNGRGRFQPRYHRVARTLQCVGFGTLVLDLLDDDEALDPLRCFDTDLLALRFHDVMSWASRTPETFGLSIGLLAMGTAAAAALIATAQARRPVGAVVSSVGRPDLAMEYLFGITSPVLFIVGDGDQELVALNRECLALLRGPRDLKVIAGVTHQTPDPATLSESALLARDWFRAHLPGASESELGVAS